MTATDARILDRGYRRYEGPRTGRRGAMSSLIRHTMQRCLGLHRPARAKVFPVLVVLLAYVPTLVYIGVTVLGNRLQREGVPGRSFAEAFIPDYAANYLQIVLAILLFAAFVAPEVLCPDRRTGMLGLYLASPLSRPTYLVSKGVAVLALVSIVTVGPPVALLAGYTTQGYGPEGITGWLGTFGRILAAGLVVAAMYTLIALAISSVTSRKAAASAAFIALMIGLPGLVTYLIVVAYQPTWLGLFNLFTLPYEAVYRVFGEPSPFVFNGEPEIAAPLVWAAYLAWCLIAVGVIADRYRRLEVTR